MLFEAMIIYNELMLLVASKHIIAQNNWNDIKTVGRLNEGIAWQTWTQ